MAKPSRRICHTIYVWRARTNTLCRPDVASSSTRLSQLKGHRVQASAVNTCFYIWLKSPVSQHTGYWGQSPIHITWRQQQGTSHTTQASLFTSTENMRVLTCLVYQISDFSIKADPSFGFSCPILNVKKNIGYVFGGGWTDDRQRQRSVTVRAERFTTAWLVFTPHYFWLTLCTLYTLSSNIVHTALIFTCLLPKYIFIFKYIPDKYTLQRCIIVENPSVSAAGETTFWAITHTHTHKKLWFQQ